jgi:hypothetical protein
MACIMERVNLSIPEVQLTWLRQQSAALGITISELVRRIIDGRRLENPMTLKKL